MRAQGNTALIAALASDAPLWSADLFTFTLASGESFRLTGADRDVQWTGNTWTASGPPIQRSGWASKNTTEVPEMTIKLFSDGADFELGNLKRLIHDGLFDGALVLLDRAFMPAFGDTSLGIVRLFGGRVGKIDITAFGATLTVVAANVLLQQNVPRNVYQRGCIHTLYDGGCRLLKAEHTGIWTVDVASLTVINMTIPLGIPNAYLLGTAAVLTGAGTGQRRSIDGVGDSGVRLAYPLTVAPIPGDQVALSQGCDKSPARCTELSNSANFRGFPHIPISEMGL